MTIDSNARPEHPPDVHQQGSVREYKASTPVFAASVMSRQSDNSGKRKKGQQQSEMTASLDLNPQSGSISHNGSDSSDNSKDDDDDDEGMADVVGEFFSNGQLVWIGGGVSSKRSNRSNNANLSASMMEV